jgi:hypothetical protein
MIRRLDDRQRCRYEHDGIVYPIEVLSTEEARHYRAACDALEAQLGGRPRTVEVRQMHLHFPWAYALATHPRVLDAVEGILGSNLLVWATELFVKHPRDPAVSIRWHRDRTYMGFDAATTATAWVALSDSTAANGCMCAAPGPGRRHNRAPAEIDLSPANNRKMAVNEPDRHDVVQVELRAGEMSLHDADILHGSSPNHSDDKRVGFVIRFVTPAAQPLAGRAPAVLARGHDDAGHFLIVGPPPEAGQEQALAAMKQSAGLHLEAMLQNLRRTGSEARSP